ncbi:MAG: transporter substrate-binding domain-containing protein [Methanospirillaceae archaeon]|nr:transporter substrate-binding domain-containing protein [Methanospirillaceae archaeon]
MRYYGMIIGLILMVMVCFCTLATAIQPHNDSDTAIAQPDKLGEILSQGTLIVAIDKEGAPLTAVKEGVATGSSDDIVDSYTRDQVTGFCVDIADSVADELGVDAVFVTPEFEDIANGNWNDNWDLFTNFYITRDRLSTFFFTDAICSEPSLFYKRNDEPGIVSPGDLSGKKIGVLGHSAQFNYLNNTLNMPGIMYENPVVSGTIIEYETELVALDALSHKAVDAILVSESTGDFAIGEGYQIQPLSSPAFIGYSAFALDKAGSTNPESLIKKMNEIIRKMHDSGELTRLSTEYFDKDITTEARQFDVASLNQFNENVL